MIYRGALLPNNLTEEPSARAQLEKTIVLCNIDSLILRNN